MAQLARHLLVEEPRLHRLQEAGLLGAPQAARVHGHQHIGGAARPLLLHALDDRVVARLDAIDLVSGEPGEVFIQGFVSLVMPRRVQVQNPFLSKSRSRCGREQQR